MSREPRSDPRGTERVLHVLRCPEYSLPNATLANPNPRRNMWSLRIPGKSQFFKSLSLKCFHIKSQSCTCFHIEDLSLLSFYPIMYVNTQTIFVCQGFPNGKEFFDGYLDLFPEIFYYRTYKKYMYDLLYFPHILSRNQLLLQEISFL